MIHEVIVNGIDVTTRIVAWSTETEFDVAIDEATIILPNSIKDILNWKLDNSVTIKRGFVSVDEDFVFDG
jgi:hypothetical protein